MSGAERRRHVRVKPSFEVPARVALLGDGLMREMLDIVDISVSGMSLTSPALRGTPLGKVMKLQITFGKTDDHTVEVITRWASPETIGVELVNASPAVTHAFGHYVAELLERGGNA